MGRMKGAVVNHGRSKGAQMPGPKILKEIAGLIDPLKQGRILGPYFLRLFSGGGMAAKGVAPLECLRSERFSLSNLWESEDS